MWDKLSLCTDYSGNKVILEKRLGQVTHLGFEFCVDPEKGDQIGRSFAQLELFTLDSFFN
jgi:hypothetical protein